MKSAITVVEGNCDNCVGHNTKKNSERQDPNLWKSSLLALQDPLEVMLRLVFMRLYWCDPSEWWYLKTLLIWQVRILMIVTIMTFFREWSYISHVMRMHWSYISPVIENAVRQFRLQHCPPPITPSPPTPPTFRVSLPTSTVAMLPFFSSFSKTWPRRISVDNLIF